MSVSVSDTNPEPDQEGRRERKKRQTREVLMAKAAELFAENGFDETTTEDIAEAADLSQRTFFRHFSSKEAVLYGDMDGLRVRVREALTERPHDEPPVAAIRQAMMTVTERYEEDRDHRFLQARLAAGYPSVSAYFRAVVQTEWEKELIAVLGARLGVDPMNDPRPEIMAGAAMSALRVSIRRWTASAGKDHLPTLIAEAFDALEQLGELTAA